MNSTLHRIVILDKNVKGDLRRCSQCGINFTTLQPCIVCQAIIEKEQEVGRKLTKEEFDETIKTFVGGEA